jgi:hypothetical protein
MKMLPILLLMFSPLISAAEFNIQTVKSCSQIKNDLKRLVCFDKAVAGEEVTQKQSTVPAEIADNKAVPPTPPALSSKEDFGLEYKQIAESGSAITSKVTKVSTKPRGELIINLENGHVWHQTGNDRFKLNEGETVTITRGVFNSFTLKVDGRNKGIKVKRK